MRRKSMGGPFFSFVAGFCIVVVVLKIVALSAQAPATGYQVQVYRAVDPTTGTPFRTQDYVVALALCDQAATPAPAGTVINPTMLEFDDPLRTGRVCRLPVASLVTGLPAATGYRATLTALSTVGPSGRSNSTSPFDAAPVPPAVPGNVGVRP